MEAIVGYEMAGYEIVGYEIGGIGDAGLEICVRDIEKKGTFSLQSFIEIVDIVYIVYRI